MSGSGFVCAELLDTPVRGVVPPISYTRFLCIRQRSGYIREVYSELDGIILHVRMVIVMRWLRTEVGRLVWSCS